MTTKNENVNEVANVEENELTVIQRETDDFVVLKDENGKFKRKAKFKDYSSVVIKDRKDKMWLVSILEGDEESGNGLKSHVGKQIEVQNVITRTYDKINEDTGVLEYGVLTYLIDPSGIAYVTSSKSVYFTINRLMEYFGTPDSEEWENITVLVKSKKMQNGDSIEIKMVG